MLVVLLFVTAILACFALPLAPEVARRRALRREQAEQGEVDRVQQLRREEFEVAEQARQLELDLSAQIRADPVAKARLLAARADVNLLGGLRLQQSLCEDEARALGEAAERAEVAARAAHAQVPAWLRSGVGRVVVLVGAWLLPFTVVLLCVLDYPLFAATQGPWVAAIVTPLTVLTLAVCSVGLGVGLGWHPLLKGSTAYFRRVLVAVSALCLVGTLIFLTYLAPHRSAARHNEAISAARADLSLAERRKTEGQQVSEAVLALKRDRLAAEQRAGADAARVDQLIVLVAAMIELPLVEAGLAAAQLVPGRIADRRRAVAKEAAAEAARAAVVARADTHRAVRTAVTDVADFLTTHGVQDVERVIQESFAWLNVSNVALQVLVEVERVRSEVDPAAPHLRHADTGAAGGWPAESLSRGGAIAGGVVAAAADEGVRATADDVVDPSGVRVIDLRGAGTEGALVDPSATGPASKGGDTRSGEEMSAGPVVQVVDPAPRELDSRLSPDDPRPATQRARDEAGPPGIAALDDLDELR